MRLSSNKLTVRLRRHLFDERTLTAGWLALTICLVIAAPGALAQGPNPSPTGTATGTMPTEAPGNFKRKTRLMQDDTQAADSGDGSPDMMRRKRMRQAIMRARQMDAGSDGQPAETLNRGPNGDEAFTGTMGRKGRGAFMPDGPGQGAGQGRRGFGGRGAFAGRKRALDLAPLNLTEEQKGKIQQLRIRTATRSRELRRKLMSGGQELRDLMFDPSASDDTIRAKGRELRKLH